MCTFPRVFCAALILVSLLCLAAPAWWPHDPASPLVVCDAVEQQAYPRVASDGFGGTFIVWEDQRDGRWDLYGQHLDAWGHALWPPGGLGIENGPRGQLNPCVVESDPGTFIVTWMDRTTSTWDIYAQKIEAGGDPLWATGGVAVCAQDSGQFNNVALADGAGGVFVAWSDDRAGEFLWDIYAQRLDASGLPLWTTDGVPVCTAVEAQDGIHMVSDSEGGVIIGWRDERGLGDDWHVYAQRLSADGVPVWTPDGVAVYSNPGENSLTAMVSDGAGGALFVWEKAIVGEIDILAQRLDGWSHALWSGGITVRATTNLEYRPVATTDGAGGLIVAWLEATGPAANPDLRAQRIDRWGTALWSPAGEDVCAHPGYKSGPVIVADDTGGAILAWEDSRNGLGKADIYVQRIDPDGSPLWTVDGVAVGAGQDPDGFSDLVDDGAGGAFLVWNYGDLEGFGEGDILAQRVEGHGFLGYPAPQVVEVVDHPADQGGRVLVTWVRSYLDAFPWQEVTHYSVWRRLPEPEPVIPDVAKAAAACGLAAEVILEFAQTGWEYVDQVPASYWEQYAYDAPTYADSTAADSLATEFQIVAQTGDQWKFWASPPARGYSVDNLAPGAPLALAAVESAAGVELAWSPSGWHDEDLGAYHLYRSDVSGFVPGPANFLATVPDTLFTDVGTVGGTTWYYLVSAVDVHGNEGPASNEASILTVSAAGGSGVPTAFKLHGASPNPFNPRTTIGFDVPAGGGHVRLRIFDVRGRLVAVLADGFRGGGRQAIAWNGVDGQGRAVPSGVYSCRLEAGDREETVKMMLLR